MPVHNPPPRDRTKTEHVARVERVVFENPDSGFVILALGDGHTAMGAAAGDQFGSGLTYRFLGRWEDDPQRGYRFRFGTFVVHGAHSRGGVVKYLTDLCEGIGPKTAEKLWVAYGADAVTKLRDEPMLVIAETGLNPEVIGEASEALQRDKAHQHTKIDLNGLFAGRGFVGGKLIDECLRRWGAKAAEVVRKNPFRLLNMPSAGFRRCDKLYLDLGLNPKALKRQAICTVQLVRDDRNGHTWLAADDLANKLEDLIPQADPRRAFLLGLRAGLLAKRREPDGLYLTTANRAFAERLIADSLRRLGGVAPAWPTDRVPVSRQDGDKLPSAHQLERLTLATAGPVGLFCGGPGTGKTHTLAYLLRELIAEHGRDAVAVIAPTGKAAVRARQSLAAAGLDLPTGTIHSKLIECGRLGMTGDDADDMDGFEDAPDGLLTERFIIVDETSMVDANLMAVLLSACPTGTHVLFVGDPFQLPPVGHGSPLRDLIAAGLPYGELTHVRRNAGQIVHACLRIKNGESFDTTDAVDLTADPPRNLRLIPARDEADAAEVLDGLLRAMKAFHPVWGTQVIVARNKGAQLTRKELNGRLQGLLNPDGKTVTNNPFRVGDKVICTKNAKQQAVGLHPAAAAPEDDPEAYATVYERDRWSGRGHREPKLVYVANGEIGRVLAVGPKVMIARFSEGDLPVRVPLGGKSADERKGEPAGVEDEGRGCNFDLAYAVTCHKMQGSEAPCVIIVGDAQAGGVANREWIYTAVSRAAKVCVLIGQPGVFARMAARQMTTKRKTFLVELMAETMTSTE